MSERLGLVGLTNESGDPGLLTFPTKKGGSQLVDQIFGSDQLQGRFGGEVRGFTNIEHMFDTLPTTPDKFKGFAAEI